MALKQCKECGNTVSNQAKSCPHCGARVKKSRWGITILFALIVGSCVIILLVMRGQQIIEQEKAEVDRPEKAEVERKAMVEDTVKEGLAEDYGVQCTSINLFEGTDGHFAGNVKLEDGRELDIDGTIEGDMVRYTHRVKQGYEYKCKHHIGQLELNERLFFNEKKGVLSGEIWNDGSEPIRGFVAAEFIDDYGRVYYRDQEIPDPYTGTYGEAAADWWIPPSKSAMFKYFVPDDMLKSNCINVKLEFFNLGNESLASYVFDNDNPNYESKSILETINVKVTSQIYKIQIDKANKDAEQ